MFTVQDVIHLIQYYYQTASWEGAIPDVEQIRLNDIRSQCLLCHASGCRADQS